MWTPIPPLWVQSGKHTNLVAVAQLNDSYKCYQIKVPYVNPKCVTVAKASITNQEPLGRELERMREGVKVGESIASDIPVILADWMALLARPTLEEALIGHIAAVAALSTDLPANTRKIIHEVNKVSELLNEKQVARDPLFGEICGNEYSSVELARFQMPSRSPKVNAHSPEQYSFRLTIGSRLQNQDWRVIVYLRDKEHRLTQSFIRDFRCDDNPVYSVYFEHVLAADPYLIVEISIREPNRSFSRIACGAMSLASRSTELTMHAPFAGRWNGFLQSIIAGNRNDKCPLISSIQVAPCSTTGTPQYVSSLVKDGFNSYDSLHLEIGDFHADSDTNSAYHLRFKCQGLGRVDQDVSSALLSGANSEQCFTFSDITYGEVIKAELWREKALVSVVSIPYEKKQFCVSFGSLTTFQSISFTKNVAILRFHATFMGHTGKCEATEVVENYRKYSEAQVLMSIRDLNINQKSFERFQSIGSSLISMIDYFNESPFIHEAAFIALLSLLELGHDYPYIMKQLLESGKLTLTSKRNMLSAVLRQIFNLLSCDQTVHQLVNQSQAISDLVLFLSPGDVYSSQVSDFYVKKVSQTPPLLPRPPTIRALQNSRSSLKILDKVRIQNSNSPEANENDLLWRTSPILDQIKDIVNTLEQAYTRVPIETKLVIMRNLENLFESFKKILGDSAVLLLFTLLSSISWSTTCPELNTEKLLILARIPANWKLDTHTGTLYANICIKSIAPVWVGKKDSRRWVDVHAAACILQSLLDNIDLTSMINVLSEFLPLSIDIASDLASLSRHGFDENFEEIFNTTCHTNSETIALEFMLLIQQLLQLNSEIVVDSFSVLGQSHLRQMILKTLSVCAFWLDFSLLKSEWYSLRLVQLNAICASLGYMSQILVSYFSPSPDANVHFDADIWYKFFVFVSQFILSKDLKVPVGKIQSVAHHKLVRSTLNKATAILENSWNSLQWRHPISDRKNPLYGYQVSLFCCHQSITASFVELVFNGQKAIEPILRQIVATEWMLNQDLHEMTLEFLGAVDDLFLKQLGACGQVPSIKQCERFIDIFDSQVDHYSEFMCILEGYLSLLCDKYLYDSLLTVQRIIKFLKKHKANDLLSKYLGFILSAEKNPRVLGLAFMELASIYKWADKSIAPPLTYYPLVEQRACDRKENLLVMATQCFINGSHWLLAIEVTRECQIYYEKTLDYRKLSLVFSRLAQFYERLTIEKHVFPNYYYVEFGEGCTGLTGEKFICEQPPNVRLDSFTANIKKKYKDGNITIKTVEPVSSCEPNGDSVMPWLSESLKTHKVSQFVSSTPMPHNDMLDMKIEKITYITEEPLPTVTGQSIVLESSRHEMSPIENAINVLMSRKRELRIICARHNNLDPELKTSVYLELLLGSTVSSPINGGLTQYKELLKGDSTHELRRAFQELRESTREALDLYSKIIDEAMRPQYEHFMEMFRVNFDLAMPGLQVRVGE